VLPRLAAPINLVSVDKISEETNLGKEEIDMCKTCGCGIADKKHPMYGKGKPKKAVAKKKPAAKK
jgi:hypothetical protein